MPTALKLSGTSFTQPAIKELKINDPITLESNVVSESDSEVEDLDGGNNDPAIVCKHNNILIGYVPKEHKKKVRQLLKDGKTFKIYKLNTFKENPIIGVRIISV